MISKKGEVRIKKRERVVIFENEDEVKNVEKMLRVSIELL